MRARWLLVFAVVGCQSKSPPAAKATGSASVVATAPADAQAIDAAAPKLAISCGPAMLAPRIPPPPKKKQPDAPIDWGAAIDSASGMDSASNGFGGLGLRGQGGGTGDMIGTGVGIGGGGYIGIGRQSGYSPETLLYKDLNVQGATDKAIINRILRQNRPKFATCFKADVKKAGTNTLQSTIKFVITPTGDVQSPQVSGSAIDCLQHALQTARFPAVDGGGIDVVSLRFEYSAEVNPPSPTDRRGGVTAATHAAPKPVVKPPPVPDTRSWTPYAASLGLASDDTAQAAGDELVKLMPLAKLEKCFAGKNASERTMVTVAFDGGVIAARSGGSGDAEVDSCISLALIGLKVTAPPTVSEVACDIVRGDPQPWRVAPDGYTVIEVGDKEIKEGGVVLTKDKLVPATADATHAFLIVVDPAAQPAMLASAFARTAWAGATLVALKSDSGSPTFIAMGLDGRMREPDYAPMLGIQHVKDDVKSCVDKEARGTAPKAEVETLLNTLANACDPKPCPATLSIALSGTMQDLAADADAARRAKLTRIGLSTTGCP